jgi:drug/metabolite transporter (DMT)-like permease
MTTESAFNQSMTLHEWALLAVLSVLWGGSFFFVGVAVKELPPLTIVVLRVALAAIVLCVVARMMRTPIPRTGRDWRAFLAMGLLNNVLPFVLIVWAQTRVASGVASILNATTPLFTVVVAHCLTSDEKLTIGRVIGVVVGFGGVAIMVGGVAIESLDVDVFAQVGILLAAMSYACAAVFGRRFRAMGVPPLVTATGQLLASSIILIPAEFIIDRPWTYACPSTEAVLAVAGLAILSTVLAYIVYFRILATAGAANLSLVTFLIPVTAILLGLCVLHESLQPKHVLGLVLIGIGLACVDGRLLRIAPWAVVGRARK